LEKWPLGYFDEKMRLKLDHLSAGKKIKVHFSPGKSFGIASLGYFDEKMRLKLDHLSAGKKIKVHFSPGKSFGIAS